MPFPRVFFPKVNVIEWLEFKLSYYDSAVQRFNHYTTMTPSLPNLISLVGKKKKFINVNTSLNLFWWRPNLAYYSLLQALKKRCLVKDIILSIIKAITVVRITKTSWTMWWNSFEQELWNFPLKIPNWIALQKYLIFQSDHCEREKKIT